MARDKDNSLVQKLKELVQDEKTAAMRAEVARERQISRAAQIEEIEKGRIVHDERGQPYDRWEQVINRANHAMKVDGKSYNTFQTVMFDLIEMYTELNEAIFQDLKELAVHTGHLLLDGPVVKGTQLPGLLTVVDAIGEKISGKPNVVLPKLQYLVEATDEGTLSFAKLQRYENDDLGAAINNIFKKGVNNWLNQQGYWSNEDGQYSNRAGEVLTKASFDALKEDPDVGLAKILSKRFDMPLEESPAGPRP